MVAPSPEAKFIKGLDLCQAFFVEAVEPIIGLNFPQLKYSACLIGSGSEVLGFDTEMSSDHHWGPRVMIFVGEDHLPKYKEQMVEIFRHKLPRTFKGYPTGYTAADSHDKGVQLLDRTEEGPINHRIEVSTIAAFLRDYLGFETGDGGESCQDFAIRVCDWLTIPEQKLCSITAGRVFRDQVGLERMRSRLTYYPHDVWLYLLASCWSSIEQNEHLMGRAGFVGDELGSALIAARLVRDIMRLSFLMAKCYAPYPKWFGTAFSRLAAAEKLRPLLSQILHATSWEEREKLFSPAYEYLAALHNQLEITEPMPQKVRAFHDRPFMVISMGDFSRAIAGKITDPQVSLLLAKPLIGSVDQYSESTDLLADPCWRRQLIGLTGRCGDLDVD